MGRAYTLGWACCSGWFHFKILLLSWLYHHCSLHAAPEKKTESHFQCSVHTVKSLCPNSKRLLEWPWCSRACSQICTQTAEIRQHVKPSRSFSKSLQAISAHTPPPSSPQWCQIGYISPVRLVLSEVCVDSISIDNILYISNIFLSFCVPDLYDVLSNLHEWK